jgi:PadR family transcriptional regulator PadR
MPEQSDVLQATPALMVLKTLDLFGPRHGYGIARRIGNISGDLLAVNQGIFYPLLLKQEPDGAIASDCGASENNGRAGKLQTETRDWEQMTAIIARFFDVKVQDLS